MHNVICSPAGLLLIVLSALNPQVVPGPAGSDVVAVKSTDDVDASTVPEAPADADEDLPTYRLTFRALLGNDSPTFTVMSRSESFEILVERNSADRELSILIEGSTRSAPKGDNVVVTFSTEIRLGSNPDGSDGTAVVEGSAELPLSKETILATFGGDQLVVTVERVDTNP